MHKKLFLDTMIFLHFRPLRDLGLPSVVSADQITLVMPRVTIRELEKHKSNHASRKIQDRARQVLTSLESAITTGRPLDGGIAVEPFANYPAEQITSLSLNAEWADDVLMATVLAYQATNPHENVVVVTDDTGLRLHCLTHGLAVVGLDAGLKLPEELSEVEKENRSLKQQLAQLKNALPKMVVRFHGQAESDNEFRFALSACPSLEQAEVEAALAERRSRFPKKMLPGDHYSGQSSASSISAAIQAAASSGTFGISPEQIRKYNKQLDGYFSQMEEHYKRQQLWREQRSRTISFTIEVANVGKAPADDIDVELHFPDGFKLYSEDELPAEPIAPDPPKEPLSRAEEIQQVTMGIGLTRSFDPALLNMRPASSFQIKETNSYLVTDRYDNLKHGMANAMPTMYVEFPSISEAKSFHCSYRVHCANLPEPAKGMLHFVNESRGP